MTGVGARSRATRGPAERPSPTPGGRTLRTSFVLVAAILTCGCLAVVSPRHGRPVDVGSGSALVFGRIRVTSPGYRREILVFSRNPMEHVVPPDPMLNVELRGIRPPGGAVAYASHPSPEIEEDGTFHWVLPQGEYVLASNPRPYGSSRFDPAETAVLARFGVPPGARTVYLGTLEVAVDFGTGDVIEAFKGRETPYTILRLSVVDEGDRELPSLLSTYPSVPEPIVTMPMVPAAPESQ